MATNKEAVGPNSDLNDAIISSAFGVYGDCGFNPTAHASGFIRDAEIENLLADYSRPLFLAAGLNPNTVGIALINNKSLNAFVANGQNIYFHTGLILESEDPNMVIGVIAHEMAILSAATCRARPPLTKPNARRWLQQFWVWLSAGGRRMSGWRLSPAASTLSTQVFVFQPRAGIECRRDCPAAFGRYGSTVPTALSA